MYMYTDRKISYMNMCISVSHLRFASLGFWFFIFNTTEQLTIFTTFKSNELFTSQYLGIYWLPPTGNSTWKTELCTRLIRQKSQHLYLEELVTSKLRRNKEKLESMIRLLDCFSWVTNRLNFLFLKCSQIVIMQSIQF